MKLWGGRFETGPSEIFERFSGSLHFDKRLLDIDDIHFRCYSIGILMQALIMQVLPTKLVHHCFYFGREL